MRWLIKCLATKLLLINFAESINFIDNSGSDIKIKENELLKKENSIKELTIKNEKSKSYFLIGFLFFVLMFSSLIYFRYRSKVKINQVLATKNDIISTQNDNLKKANQTKQKLFSIVAHDLINPFNAILGFSNLLENDYEELSESERKKYVSIINKQSNLNYSLAKNLLEWSRTQQKELSINKQNFLLKPIIKEVLSNYSLLSKSKGLNVSVNIDDELMVFADKNCIETLLNNLYSNAIKFSKKNKTIKINANSIENEIIIKIIDQGVGMSQKQLESVLNKTEITKYSRGTENEYGTGFGLKLCLELVSLHNGKLSIDSKLGNGTSVNIQIPNN